MDLLPTTPATSDNDHSSDHHGHVSREQALEYHSSPTPGKLSVALSKPTDTSMDLALAYSPGVAEPCREIYKDPSSVYKYTAKGNLVAVVSNGTAVLGLGNLGPLASKPVMEGKGVLFKKFGGIDCYDIEVDSTDVDEFVNVVRCISGTFGGINLEDIKSPECFEIEHRLIDVCECPVFHDDQHGTAIVTAAAMLNALDVAGKKVEDVKMVCLGAGAAAISCLKLLVELGMSRKNIYMIDTRGLIYEGRANVNKYKELFQQSAEVAQSYGGGEIPLEEVIKGADVFLGLSGPNLLTADMLDSMAPKCPIVFACANPDPEIMPELAKEVRPDVLIATGRSDYPNQVNNVLGFPYIFRGALDVRAKRINKEMKIAAVHAIRDVAKLPVPHQVEQAYEGQHFTYGPEYFVPKPLDPRLLGLVSDAVAKAAIETGVATKSYPKHYPLCTVEDIFPPS